MKNWVLIGLIHMYHNIKKDNLLKMLTEVVFDLMKPIMKKDSRLITLLV